MAKVTILLDTHIFLWWLFDDNRLPAGIRVAIENIDNIIYVSSASVWEISTKFRLGKLPKAVSVAKNVPGWIEKAGFKSLSISPAHAQLAGDWDMVHRDPFDRMLAAQVQIDKMCLASVDKMLQQFPIEIMRR